MTREDAIQWLEAMKSAYALPIETYEAIDMAIEALLTDIVRCKDCKHAYKRKPIDKTAVLCELFGAGMKDNDFCSHGERSDNANTD